MFQAKFSSIKFSTHIIVVHLLGSRCMLLKTCTAVPDTRCGYSGSIKFSTMCYISVNTTFDACCVEAAQNYTHDSLKSAELARGKWHFAEESAVETSLGQNAHAWQPRQAGSMAS